MALSDYDRELRERCLARQTRAWEDFVDRFLGLVIHVVNHTVDSRCVPITLPDREGLAADVFVAILENDFAILRRFRGESSLATYLTVISRRVVVRELLKLKIASGASARFDGDEAVDPSAAPEERLENREEVQRLLSDLPGEEADIVRMYHLEGKSYHEISSHVGVPENSIGPMLSRARARMRRSGVDSAAG